MNVTASPIPIDINGKEYLLKPLSDDAIQQVSNWVRGSFIASVRESLVDAPAQEWTRSMELAFKTSQSIDWLSEEGQKAILTLDGQAKLLHVSLVPTTVGITYAKCRDMFYTKDDAGNRVPNGDVLEDFADKFGLVNDLQIDDSDDPSKKKD